MEFPIQLPGKLEKKVSKFDSLSKTLVEKREALRKLLAEVKNAEKGKKELETDIDRHLLNGERISDEVLDYCFRQFTHKIEETEPMVREFLERVKSLEGQKMLTVYGDAPTDVGIICGQGQFAVERTFNYLSVPVKEHKFLDTEKNKWRTGRGKININPDIFKYPDGFKIKWIGEDAPKGYIYCTNHSGLKYIGGPGPEETTLYLGDERVKDGLELHSEVKVKIPEQKRTQQVPSPF